VLPCIYNPTYPHDHHAPPTFHTPPLTAPWHPALSAISPPLAPSHHRASTDHRLPPPRIITTAGKGFHPSARALSLLGSRSHAASQQLRTSACAPRHCCTNTVVCRARHTRGSLQEDGVVPLARERSHIAWLSAWLSVCVYSTTGCTASCWGDIGGTSAHLSFGAGAEVDPPRC
jgi:hypothetical protein